MVIHVYYVLKYGTIGIVGTIVVELTELSSRVNHGNEQ